MDGANGSGYKTQPNAESSQTMPTSNQINQERIQIPRNPVLAMNLLGRVRVMAIQMMRRRMRMVTKALQKDHQFMGAEWGVLEGM